MRAAVISDIHIDEQRDETGFEEAFAECVNESGADFLLIAGDISEYYLRTLPFVRRLRERISARIYFCPGNHDLWSKFESGVDARDILNYMEREPGFLQNKAVLLTDRTVLIGGCGWYDYSFAYPGKFTEDHLEQKNYMGRWWKDGKYARHNMSDAEVNRLWNSELAALADQYSQYDIIFMTHMVNHPAFLVGEDHPLYEMFQYFNGFMGSSGLYEITKRKNVKYAISGHVHYRKSFMENDVYYMCRCLGYEKEFPAFGGVQDLKSQILSAMEVIEIQ